MDKEIKFMNLIIVDFDPEWDEKLELWPLSWKGKIMTVPRSKSHCIEIKERGGK